MNASFNDTLDNIKRTLNMAQNCHEESETTGSLAYAESAMKRAAALYIRRPLRTPSSRPKSCLSSPTAWYELPTCWTAGRRDIGDDEMTMRDDDGWRSYWLQRVGDELGRYVASGGRLEVLMEDKDGRRVTLIELPGDVVVVLEAAVERGRLDQLYPVAGRSRELNGNRAMTETPPAEGLPEPGERVQIILDAVRGPLGDRWIVEEPHPRLIADEVVTAWRKPFVGNKVEFKLSPMQTAARESE